MGLRVPLASSAAGKILLLNESSLVLQALGSMQAGKQEALQAELSQIRLSGIATDSEAHDPALQVAATAILNDEGQVAASLALNVSGPQRLSPEWAEALKATALKVSCSLGWTHA